MTNSSYNIQSSKSNPACCPSNEIVLDEGCITNVFSTGSIATLYNGPSRYMAVTISSNPAFAPTNGLMFISVRHGNATFNSGPVYFGSSVTYVFRNINRITISFVPGNITSIRLTMCYRIYQKQPIESCDDCSSTTPCCDQPTLVLDKFCGRISSQLSGGATYWFDEFAFPTQVNTFVNPYSQVNGQFTLTLADGSTIVYILTKGESFSGVFNLRSISVTSAPGSDAESWLIGSFNLLVNRKVY